jgi:hypothetical protein
MGIEDEETAPCVTTEERGGRLFLSGKYMWCAGGLSRFVSVDRSPFCLTFFFDHRSSKQLAPSRSVVATFFLLSLLEIGTRPAAFAQLAIVLY